MLRELTSACYQEGGLGTRKNLTIMETGCHPFIDERCTFTVSHKAMKSIKNTYFFPLKSLLFLVNIVVDMINHIPLRSMLCVTFTVLIFLQPFRKSLH